MSVAAAPRFAHVCRHVDGNRCYFVGHFFGCDVYAHTLTGDTRLELLDRLVARWGDQPEEVCAMSVLSLVESVAEGAWTVPKTIGLHPFRGHLFSDSSDRPVRALYCGLMVYPYRYALTDHLPEEQPHAGDEERLLPSRKRARRRSTAESAAAELAVERGDISSAGEDGGADGGHS